MNTPEACLHEHLHPRRVDWSHTICLDCGSHVVVQIVHWPTGETPEEQTKRLHRLLDAGYTKEPIRLTPQERAMLRCLLTGGEDLFGELAVLDSLRAKGLVEPYKLEATQLGREVAVIPIHAGPYPHQGGCEGCREERVCNGCGSPFDSRGAYCTNGRCATCHNHCTSGGNITPGHGYGSLGQKAAHESPIDPPKETR